MKKYKVIDTLNIYEDRIMSELEIRNIYKDCVKDTLFNWIDCKDNKCLDSIMEELANVYTCDFNFVISNLYYDINYKIEECE